MMEYDVPQQTAPVPRTQLATMSLFCCIISADAKGFFFWLCFLLKPRITFVLHSPNSAGSAAAWTIGDYDEKSGMNSGDEDV